MINYQLLIVNVILSLRYKFTNFLRRNKLRLNELDYTDIFNY